MSDRHPARRSKILSWYLMLITTMGAKIHHQLKSSIQVTVFPDFTSSATSRFDASPARGSTPGSPERVSFFLSFRTGKSRKQTSARNSLKDELLVSSSIPSSCLGTKSCFKAGGGARTNTYSTITRISRLR